MSDEIISAMAAEIRRLEAENARLREALGLIQDRFGPEVGQIANASVSATHGSVER